MPIHLIPVTQGMNRDEIGRRLQSGWQLVGRQAVNLNTGIVDPTMPPTATGIVDVDIWAIAEPMIPARVVATALVETHRAQGDPGLMLDDVTRMLFGEGIIPLAESFERSAAEQGETKDGTDSGT